MKEQKNRFKINYSLAYTLRNIKTDELRYFQASCNNHLMLEIALLVSNRQELQDFKFYRGRKFYREYNKTRHKMENNSNFKHYLLHQSFARHAIRSSHPFI